MTDLPQGWTSGPLSDFIQPRGERVIPADFPELPFIGMDHVEAHTTRIIGSVSAGQMKSNASRFTKNDVLYGRLRPYLNKVAQPQFNGLASAEFIVFRGNSLIDPSFLRHRLNSRDFVSFASHLNEGDRPRVAFDQIGGFQLQVPPLNEQRRIVERIEALFEEIDRGVESLRLAKNTTTLYRQSLLKSAFEGQLTAEWRAQNPGKLESPDALLAHVREQREGRYRDALDDWERTVAEWRKDGGKGKRPAKPKRPEGFDLLRTSDHLPWPSARVQVLLNVPLINGRSVKDKAGGFPVLRLTALKNGRIDFQESKEGDWSREDAEPFFVQRDDIFIARGNGSKKLVGIASLALDDPIPIAFPDTMIRARLDTNAIQPEYFLLVWNSWTVRRQIEKAARTTAGIYKINQGHICGFVLPLPSLAEQAEIIRILQGRLEATEKLNLEIDTALARADALRQSILKKAFAGQLVPQDPKDEPAVALLERIRAKCTKTSARRRTKRIEA